MANNPELLKMPLARDGQKSTIPETTDASTGLFSQQYGWQSISSLPPQAGGKAVKREDFNGAFNLLGGIAFMAQKGFTFNFDAAQDYYAGCVVIDTTDNQKYECIADVAAGGSVPSADSTHWQLAGNNSADIDIWFRQANTEYANGAIALLLTLPTGWYLECTGTGGITSADDLVITSPTVGTTVTDGAVVWTIRKIGSGGDGVPLGAIIQWPINGTLPDGYLECDGSAVSRTMYDDLFAVIGTNYGAGDGSTTFNLPNQRFIVGVSISSNDQKVPVVAGTTFNNSGAYKDSALLGRQAFAYIGADSSVKAATSSNTVPYGYTGSYTSSFVTSFPSSTDTPLYASLSGISPAVTYSNNIRYIIKYE